MDWKELKGSSEIAHAPQAGTMLIYTREKVFFEQYESLQEVEERVKEKEILEVHLFDKEKEYRALATQSKRFSGNFIDKVFRAEEEDEDHIYSQEILLETRKEDRLGMKKIWVNDHITYSDTGMAVIDNYRLVEVG